MVERIDADTAERPLNISVWGGQTDFAQALWRVRRDRGTDGWAGFVRKFRVYDINDQDTPAWFFFLPLGGNDPRDPSKPGWGGQFARETDGWYRDPPARPGFDPIETVNRWRPDYQRDFAKRMAWCVPE